MPQTIFIGIVGYCKTISVDSTGSSTYDDWYETNIFGYYQLTTSDTEGNSVYQKTTGDDVYFMYKVSDNNWWVSFNNRKR